MSQSSIKEKFEDEQLLNIALAIELEDVKKTLSQLKLEKSYTQWTIQFECGLLYKEKFQRIG